MKTDWIFGEADHSLHQEFSAQDSTLNPSDNSNPAELVIDFPTSFNVTKGHTGEESFSQLSVDIPSDVMDKMAIAWCKKRRLHDAFIGSVGCEHEGQDPHSIKQEDAEMLGVVKDNEGMPEAEMNLEFDNIFDVVAKSKEEAKRLKEESDEKIKERGAIEPGGLSSKLPPLTKRTALSILNHIRAIQNVDDETSLLSAIEEALSKSHDC